MLVRFLDVTNQKRLGLTMGTSKIADTIEECEIPKYRWVP